MTFEVTQVGYLKKIQDLVISLILIDVKELLELLKYIVYVIRLDHSLTMFLNEIPTNVYVSFI